MREGMYITMTYAVIDSATNTLVLARAGHERALLSRRDPSTGSFISDYVASEGMPLGLVDAELFESVIEDKALEFLPGSTLVLYTDGLTEAPNAEENEFGTGRLADVLRTVHAAPAAKINDAILAAVQRFSGATGLRDDYTLLTVKRV
jgi:sigma-B regulation protein RsbU (phosphoserine phosphatase)